MFAHGKSVNWSKDQSVGAIDYWAVNWQSSVPQIKLIV